VDSLDLSVFHPSSPVLNDSGLGTQLQGEPNMAYLPDNWTLNTGLSTQPFPSASIPNIESPCVKISSAVSSGKKLNPFMENLDNLNPQTSQTEGFDPLLGDWQDSNADTSSTLQSTSYGDPPLSPFRKLRANVTSSVPIPAFPGAEGFGALSVGGRGGQIIEVTNLENSGHGSLRAALEAEGPRIVIFRVGGTIRLHDEIRIKDPYLTVAGQTAPGGGILLKGTDSKLLLIEKGAHDIIIRYLRLRNGSGKANGFGHDNISITGGYNIILDHVSMSWSTDENASLYRKRYDAPIYNVTIQRSNFGEGLQGHSNGLIVSGETDFSDPENPIEAWRGIKNISIHHNLFIHNDTRNPRITSSGTQVINNVIYNWKRRIGETTRGSVIDVVNNYAKAGPVSSLEHLFLHENSSPIHPNDPYPNPSIYTEGNVVEPVQPEPNSDNWNLWKLNFSYASVPASYRRSTPLQQAPIPVNVQSADDAYDSVLADVGANARLNCLGNWIPNSDAVDQRYITDVMNNGGADEPIRRPYYGGGYPDIESRKSCDDRDRDGMPNVWEDLHHFNSRDPSDGSADADGDGYTNVEEYLNGQY
jgi:pectate lyase